MLRNVIFCKSGFSLLGGPNHMRLMSRKKGVKTKLVALNSMVYFEAGLERKVKLVGRWSVSYGLMLYMLKGECGF